MLRYVGDAVIVFSGVFYLFIYVMILLSVCLRRNVLLKLFRLSTCQRTWIRILLIDTAPILLSCIGEFTLLFGVEI